MRVVHQLVWGVDPSARSSRASSLRVGGGFLALALVVILTAAGAAYVRTQSPSTGVLATAASGVAFGALWFLVSLRLPHGDAPSTALLPGAILAAVAVEVLHLVTVYYLAAKVESSSELYGALGAAAGVLLWLYLLGQVVVSSAVLNAYLWNVHRGIAPSGEGGRANHPAAGDSHDGLDAKL
jgi:uncharacterized BrkB/YihY/UPF0761 family membrane protein